MRRDISLPFSGFLSHNSYFRCGRNKLYIRYVYIPELFVMKRPLHILFWFVLLMSYIPAMSQEWEFVKEKDGIKVYTRKEANSSLKSFRGVADLHCAPEKVNNLIGNVKNVDWWDKNVKELKILSYEKEKVNRYYIVYDTPWPLADRDLVVEAFITNDPVTKTRSVRSVPLNGVIPEKEGLVRIKNYRQTWVIQTMGPNLVHIVLEGYVDPGGSIPDWLYNMVITETPLKVIHGIQEKLEKK